MEASQNILNYNSETSIFVFVIPLFTDFQNSIVFMTVLSLPVTNLFNTYSIVMLFRIK